VVEWLTPLLYIGEVAASDLGLEIIYHESFFAVFQNPFMSMPGFCVKLGHDRFLSKLFNSSFTYHPLT
jgi:hypothetical protein